MNEYYNYAENNNAGNAEQCGNVPPVNVYGRADGQFVQPQRQLQRRQRQMCIRDSEESIRHS